MKNHYEEQCTCGDYRPYTAGGAICAPLQPFDSCRGCWGSRLGVHTAEGLSESLLVTGDAKFFVLEDLYNGEALSRYIQGMSK